MSFLDRLFQRLLMADYRDHPAICKSRFCPLVNNLHHTQMKDYCSEAQHVSRNALSIFKTWRAYTYTLQSFYTLSLMDFSLFPTEFAVPPLRVFLTVFQFDRCSLYQ